MENNTVIKEVFICDTTIRHTDSGIADSLSFREKTELAEMLDKLGVTCIELGAAHETKTDILLIKSISSLLKCSSVSVSVKNESELDKVWQALKNAVHPRLQVEVTVSSVGMEYKMHMKPAAVLEYIANMIKSCKNICDDVELCAYDSTRAERDFLYSVINTAIESGANTVCLCDSTGEKLPDEFSGFISETYKNVPALSNIRLAVNCNNSMHLADACAAEAIKLGVCEIKASVADSKSISIRNITRIIAAKAQDLKLRCPVNASVAESTISRAERLCAHEDIKKSIFASEKEANNNENKFTENDSIEAIVKAASNLGYDLSEEDKIKVYEAFLKVAQKKSVGEKELEVIIASHALQVPPTYKLESYIINTGNIITATAHIKLEKNGEKLEGVSVGDGPIDAAFMALEQIMGHHYELDDFQIQAITEGREAMGETIVKLRSDGKLYSGRGTSTDILGASINAYINAVNKIVFEEVGA